MATVHSLALRRLVSISTLLLLMAVTGCAASPVQPEAREATSSHLLFSEYGRLFISNLDGTQVRSIPTKHYAADVQGFREVDQILASTWDTQNRFAIAEITLDGKVVKFYPYPLFSGPGEPALSPDGATVLFVSTDVASGAGNLQLLVLRTGESRQLTSWPQGTNVEHPQWAPDGHNIAFAAYFPSHTSSSPLGTTQVYVALPDGSAPVQISHLEHADFPAFSPDGRTLAYVGSVRVGEENLQEIDLADLTTFPNIASHKKVVARGPRVAIGDLQWSADGEWLLWGEAKTGFHWERYFRLFKVKRDGGNLQEIRLRRPWGHWLLHGIWPLEAGYGGDYDFHVWQHR